MLATKWKWIFAAVWVLIIFFNALANILPLNNRSTGDISDDVNVLFTPAGYVFSIWSLIYVLLFVWVLRSFLTKDKEHLNQYDNVKYLFVAQGVFNVAWLFSFHYEIFPLTLIVMLALLSSLILIYKQLYTVKNRSILMLLPFSVYLGWISVATIVNVGIVMNTSFGLEDGLGLANDTWTIIMLIVTALIAAVFLLVYKIKDPFPVLVFVWAFIGIYIERISEFELLAYTALVLAALMLVLCIVKAKYFNSISAK